MATIDVDFEVFKELTIRRESESMSENDVIRQLLNLPTVDTNTTGVSHAPEQGSISWVVKRVSFPHGTEFRATYKGCQYMASVKNGALELKGKRFSSPSAAAVSITGKPVNGWRFWECLKPGSTKWKLIAELRP